MKKSNLFVILILASILIPGILAIPQTLNLHGKLTDSSGNVLNGTYNMTFRIYNVSTGGSSLWEFANQTVSVDSDGIYHIILSNVNLTFVEPTYLGIQVGDDSEMTPRINLTSTPYSFRTNITDYLDSSRNYEMQNLTLGSKITFAFNEVIDNIVDGWIRITGNLNLTNFNLTAANAEFNGGWQNGGLSILNGDIYAQTGYFYNITSLNVTEQNLTLLDDLNVLGNTFLSKNLTVDTDTLFVDSNNNRVGIGTTSPSDKFVVKTETDADGILIKSSNEDAVLDLDSSSGTGDFAIIRFFKGGTIKNQIYTSDSTDDDLYINAKADLILDVTDNVGIGTTSPGQKLHVHGNVLIDDQLGIGGAPVGSDQLNIIEGEANVILGLRRTVSGSSATLNLVRYDDRGYIGVGGVNASLELNAVGAEDIYFTTNSVERMRITSDGKIGIGTTSPSAKLEVNGNMSVVQNATFQDDVIAQGILYGGGLDINGNAILSGMLKFTNVPSGHIQGLSNDFKFYTGNGYSMTIKSSVGSLRGDVILFENVPGRLGVNTTEPSSLLHVQGGDVLFNGTNSPQGFFFDESSSKVGIGTTSPDYTLDVSGSGMIGYTLWGKQFVSVNASTYATLTHVNGSALSTSYQYRISLVTQGTGTDTGAQYLVWYDADTSAWNVRFVNRRGNDSNHPEIFLDSGTPKIKTSHATLYNVNVIKEAMYSVNSHSMPAIWGASYQWQKDINDIFYNDGNVGIGTSSPDDLLDVSSSGQPAVKIQSTGTSSAILKLTNTNDEYQVYLEGATGDLRFWNGADRVTIEPGGNVGIGTSSPETIASWTSPDTLLNVKDTSNRAILAAEGSTGAVLSLVDSGGAANDKWLWFEVDGGIAHFLSAEDSGNTRVSKILVMDLGTGNVGIGTMTPSFNLDVWDSGNVITRFKSSNDDVQVILDRFSKASHEAIVMFKTNGGTGHTWAIGTDNDDTDNFYIGGNVLINKYVTIAPTTGKVGIGTTSPSDKFHINGSATAIKIESAGEYVRIVPNWGDGDVFANIHSSAGQQLRFGANDQSANGHITIDTDGDVGIGTISPGAYRLYVSGAEAYCDQTTCWNDASSRQMKKDIKEIKNKEELAKEMEVLKVYTFRMNETYFAEKNSSTTNETHVGFMADEVPDDCATVDKKGLNANCMVAHLTILVQQQQTQIETMKQALCEMGRGEFC